MWAFLKISYGNFNGPSVVKKVWKYQIVALPLYQISVRLRLQRFWIGIEEMELWFDCMLACIHTREREKNCP